MNSVSNDIIAQVYDFDEQGLDEFLDIEDVVRDSSMEEIEEAREKIEKMGPEWARKVYEEYEAERIRKWQSSDKYKEWLKEKELLDKNECPF